MTIHQRFRTPNSVRTKDYHGLDGEMIRRVAPSIYAESAHESRSDRYTYIPTIDIMRRLYREGFVPMEVSQARTRDVGKREHTKHMVKMRHQKTLENERVARVGAAVPEIILINSHDGSSRLKLVGGLLVFACENGLVVADGNSAEYSIMHTGQIADETITAAYSIVDETIKKMDYIDLMKQRALNPTEYYRFIEEAKALRWENDVRLITPLDVPRRSEDRGNDLWRTFNRVQENMMNGGLTTYNPSNRVRRRGSSRPVTNINENVQLNKDLWGLAVKYLENA